MKPKLAVCTVWSSPFMFTNYVDSTCDMLCNPPDGWEITHIRGAGWCPARRHMNACEKAMEWGADLILIIGADQVHPPDMLGRLVARFQEGYEVVAAMVPCRGYVHWQPMRPFQPMAWRFKRNQETGTSEILDYNGMEVDQDLVHVIDPADGDMQICNFIGSGVLLFHRDHLLALEKPWFKERVDFETQQRTANMDALFVWRLQHEAQAKVWVDCTIKVKHAHVMEIDEDYQHRFQDWTLGGGDPSICMYEKGGAEKEPEAAHAAG